MILVHAVAGRVAALFIIGTEAQFTGFKITLDCASAGAIVAIALLGLFGRMQQGDRGGAAVAGNDQGHGGVFYNAR